MCNSTLKVPLRIIFGSSILTLLQSILTPYLMSATERWPGLYYVLTSQFKFGEPESPWAYRLLKPIIAGVMPGDSRYNFLILNYIALNLALIGIYLLLKGYKFSNSWAISGMVLFSFSYPFRWSLSHPWMLDDVLHSVLIFGILAISMKLYGLFSMILLMGCLNHEVSLFLIPIFLFVSAPEYFPAKKGRLIFIILPSIILLLLLRLTIPVPNAEFFTYYLGRQNITKCYEMQGGITHIIHVIYGTFGFLWLVALYGLLKKKLDRLEQSFFLLFPLSLCQLIIGCDTSRLVSINLTLLILIGLNTLNQLPRFWTWFLFGTFILRSLYRFSGLSFFHPLWLLNFPLSILTVVELMMFLILMIRHKSKLSVRQII